MKIHYNYFLELSSGFWLNISAAYFFLAIPFSTTVFDRVSSLFDCIFAFTLAYYTKLLMKK